LSYSLTNCCLDGVALDFAYYNPRGRSHLQSSLSKSM